MPARKRTRPAKIIAEVPREERPRERLLRNGAQSLSDAELLAVVLKNGLGWASALDLARDLLGETGCDIPLGDRRDCTLLVAPLEDNHQKRDTPILQWH